MKHRQTKHYSLTLLSYILLGAYVLLVTGCASTRSEPAPVVETSETPSRNSHVEAGHAEASEATESNTDTDTKAETSATDLSANQYQVQKGDTLFSIGKKFGISHEKIAQVNHVENALIYEGQVLNLADATVATNTANATNVTTQPLKLNTVQTTGSKSTTPVASTAPHAKSSQTIEQLHNVTDQNIEWRWPAKGKITADYDKRTNKGIDIQGTQGQPIHAASSGKVIYSGADIRGYGKLVIIKHNRNYLSVYAHQGNTLVKEGQFVNQGYKISEMGRDNASKSKLHFEIRKKGKTVDPKEYLPNSAA